MKELVSFEHVTKIYNRKFKALNDVSFKIGEGMFGLLGANGAGKTTLMKSLVTLNNPEKGRIIVDRYDTQKQGLEVRNIVGYLPQDFSIYPNLTAYEFLDYIAQINKINNSKVRKSKIQEVLEGVNLWQVKDKKVGGFSGGMKRRLGIAQAILKDPKILIVDEPTAGLDPEERIRFRMLLTEFSQNKCVILSTHIVEDIASSCETIGFLNKGTLMYFGSPVDFIEKVRGKVKEFCISDRKEMLYLKNTYEIISERRTSNGTFIRAIGDNLLNEEKGTLVEPNLEDAYMYYVKYDECREENIKHA